MHLEIDGYCFDTVQYYFGVLKCKINFIAMERDPAKWIIPCHENSCTMQRSRLKDTIFI